MHLLIFNLNFIIIAAYILCVKEKFYLEKVNVFPVVHLERKTVTERRANLNTVLFVRSEAASYALH